MTEEESSFDAEKVAARERARDMIQDRAIDALIAHERSFEVSFGEVLNIVDMFDAEKITVEQRGILEKHGTGKILASAENYRKIGTEGLNRAAIDWTNMAVTGVLKFKVN